jgi:bifunctional DNA-binding transcriptional regulator/antitoxin component of YhaV-PrlF toxin-antitoxin module
MVTVMSESRQLEIPEELVQRLGFQPGSRIEWVVTTDGLNLRVLPDRVDLERSLRGEGRRLMPNVDSLVEALLEDRAEDDRLEIAQELA